MSAPAPATVKWLMSVANYPRDLPSRGGLAPDVDERERATLVLPILDMAELMASDFHGAVVLDRIDLQTTRNELASDGRALAEHLSEVTHRLRVVLDALVVLIELEVACEEGPQRARSRALNAAKSALSVAAIVPCNADGGEARSRSEVAPVVVCCAATRGPMVISANNTTRVIVRMAH